jgi:Domain of unknown function (DUF4180)
MEYLIHEVEGARIIEAPPGQPLLQAASDATTLIEACYEHATQRMLLSPEHLTERFFDLSSREAGEILQKLRTYHIRLAIVRTPALQISSRVRELLADEARGRDFGLFDDRAAALAWLSGP